MWKHIREGTVLLGGIALYLLLGFAVWRLLDWYVEPASIEDPSKAATAKKDIIQALGLIMAGVAGAIGVFFTWRNLRLTQEQLRNAQEELSLTRQGQITERFTRAIDQLGATDNEGNKSLEIRLGGIYALERIALDFKEDYYWTIMAILAAYVRENAP